MAKTTTPAPASTENKRAKILKCDFTNTWQPNAKETMYFHDLILDNGEKGSCGAMQKNPPKLQVGSVIDYTIDGKGKIKVISSSGDEQNQPAKPANPKYGKGGGGSPKAKHQSEFLGFAWSYAKVATYIYERMGEMLSN